MSALLCSVLCFRLHQQFIPFIFCIIVYILTILQFIHLFYYWWAFRLHLGFAVKRTHPSFLYFFFCCTCAHISIEYIQKREITRPKGISIFKFSNNNKTVSQSLLCSVVQTEREINPLSGKKWQRDVSVGILALDGKKKKSLRRIHTYKLALIGICS